MINNILIQRLGLFSEATILILADVTVKSIILLVIGYILVSLYKASAAQRHFVWLAILISMPILPFLSQYEPSQQVKTLQKIVNVTITPTKTPAPPVIKTTPAPTNTASINGHAARAEIVNLKTLGTPSRVPLAISIKLFHRVYNFLVGMTALSLCIVWIIIAVVKFLSILSGLIRLKMLRTYHLSPVSGELYEKVSRISEEWNCRRSIQFYIANTQSRIAVPLTWGMTNCVVVLPNNAETWPFEQLHAAVSHEIAHIERGDWRSYIIASVIASIFWFNPVVWILTRWIRQESEHAADDAVINHGIKPSDYANHLLEIACLIQYTRQPIFGRTVAMVSKPKIKSRLETILKKGINRAGLNSRGRLTAATTVVFILIALSTIRFTTRALSSPWIEQKAIFAQNTSTLIIANNSHVTLPDGTIIRLAGVTDTQQKTKWWAADGHYLSKQLMPSQLTFDSLPPDAQGRAFAIDMIYDPMKEPIINYAGKPQYAWIYNPDKKVPTLLHKKPISTWWFDPYGHIKSLNHMVHNESKVSDKIQCKEVFAYCASKKTEHVNLYYGIATGPWTISITCKKTQGKVAINSPSGKVLFSLDTNPHHLSPDKAMQGNAIVMVSDYFRAPSPSQAENPQQVEMNNSGNLERMILGLDKSGKVVAELPAFPFPTVDDQQVPKIMQNTHISNVLLKRIASFQLLARPYKWVEFPNVSINPIR